MFVGDKLPQHAALGIYKRHTNISVPLEQGLPLVQAPDVHRSSGGESFVF
jgi:hypothetical protein